MAKAPAKKTPAKKVVKKAPPKKAPPKKAVKRTNKRKRTVQQTKVTSALAARVLRCWINDDDITLAGLAKKFKLTTITAQAIVVTSPGQVNVDNPFRILH